MPQEVGKGPHGNARTRLIGLGLIGLAAATIALGKDCSQYLDLIIPAVLSCFASQDSRIRYYSTESLYNIAKVAKGETLLYFNEIFDMLCRVRRFTRQGVFPH